MHIQLTAHLEERSSADFRAFYSSIPECRVETITLRSTAIRIVAKAVRLGVALSSVNGILVGLLSLVNLGPVRSQNLQVAATPINKD